MLEPGTKILMTKGYKGKTGTIKEKTDSEYEFYVIELENGIHIIAGPQSFTLKSENDN